jgi:hypothetical protein
MSRPAGFDPHFFTQQGSADGAFSGLANQPNFRIGGTWDAQRLGGAVSSPISGFIDAANVNIGLYGGANRLSQGFVLV